MYYQPTLINKIKLDLIKISSPVIKKFYFLTPFLTLESLLVYYFFLVFTFGRSFTGINIIGLRIGELMIATALFLFLYYVIFKTKKIDTLIGKKANLILKLMLLAFILNNLVYNGLASFTNPQVFRSSSFIWSLGFIFVLIFVNKVRIFDSNLFLIGILFCLPLVYILTSVYFPSILESFFNQYSDKFRLLKGSDLFMVYAIYCTFFMVRIRNNNFLYVFTFLISGILIPLIVFSSRGAAIGTIVVLFFTILKNKNAFLRNKLLFLISIAGFLICLTLSSIYLDWSKIDFEEINPEYAIKSVETTLITKRYPAERQMPVFYFFEGRLMSGDGNLNWRFQIWQDVIFDLINTNKIIFGYGYEDSIPAMEEISRQGLDGENIHVHNYFINILARGGILQLTLFLIFYYLLLLKFKEDKENNQIVAFIVAVLIVSFFDSSMESVRFPFLFFSVLSHKLHNLSK